MTNFSELERENMNRLNDNLPRVSSLEKETKTNNTIVHLELSSFTPLECFCSNFAATIKGSRIYELDLALNFS